MGKPVKFSDGLTRNQMMREARKMFPGVYGTKENAPEIADILSLQSMISPVFTGKRPIDEPPRGPLRVRVYKIDSKTNTDSLLRSFLPRLTYPTKFAPYRMQQFGECEKAFSSQTCLILQMNSINGVQLDRLRTLLMAQSIELAFVKATMVQLFCKKNGHDNLQAICKGPMLLAYGNIEPSLFKNCLYEIESSRRLLVIAGRIDGKVFSPLECQLMINDLPNRRELVGRLIHTLQNPITQLIGLVEEHILHGICSTLEARAKQLS